jgi:hypothetical protein
MFPLNMVIFHSYVNVYQRVIPWPWRTQVVYPQNLQPQPKNSYLRCDQHLFIMGQAGLLTIPGDFAGET